MPFPAGQAVDAAFSAFGKTASYTPPGGGDEVACTIIIDRPDETIELGQGRPTLNASTVEVRKSEVAEPRKGGAFVLASETLTIIDDPRTLDPERLVWTMRAR